MAIFSEEEINDLTLKATPVTTDEIEIQETGGGLSKKTTLDNIPYGATIQAGVAAAIAAAIAAEANVAMLSATKDLTDASGTQAITNVGFTPTFVEVIGLIDATSTYSIGWTNGTIHRCSHNTGTPVIVGRDGIDVRLHTSGTDFQSAIIALDADGCTLTWTKNNSPTGTADLAFVFHK